MTCWPSVIRTLRITFMKFINMNLRSWRQPRATDPLGLSPIFQCKWLFEHSLYNRCDDFNFLITNFLSRVATFRLLLIYDVFISQLICYARGCSKYDHFIIRGRQLARKLLYQGYVIRTAPEMVVLFRNTYAAPGHVQNMTVSLLEPDNWQISCSMGVMSYSTSIWESFSVTTVIS